jgi:hypothetical protein
MERWMLVDSAGEPAVLLEVGEVRWISPDFAKARARWHRGVVSDAEYSYTVSRTRTGWRIDTATLEHFA